MKRPVTLHHVAQLAGVSHTTVSMALRGDSRIKEATRARVLEAARSLAYVPNAAARSLAQGKSNNVAIVSSSFSSAYESETLRGIEKEVCCSLPHCRIVQYSTGGKHELTDSILLDLLYGSQADGVICLTDAPSPEVRQAYRDHHRALVVFNSNIKDVTVIRGDGFKGACLATAHLLERGCRRPGIVHGCWEGRNMQACDPGRFEAFMDTCAAHGIEGLSVGISRFHFAEGQAVARTIASQHWDGVFCSAGDMVAIGVMAGCRELGLAIPQDVKVVGYDNLWVSSMVHPALSTVAQPLEVMGAEAVQLIKSQMHQADSLPATGSGSQARLPEPEMRIHEPVLIQRESS